ncbi:MAG: Flp pilus assembly protein CpaB [Dehalococcoidia bacterium]
MARAIAARPASDQRNRAMLIAALFFAVVAAALVFVALQQRSDTRTSGSAAGTVDIVVAKSDVGANTVLTADMLELRAVQPDEALSGVYANVEQIVGLPSRFPLQAGEQVTGLKVGLSAVTDDKDLALVLPPGMRAVAVKVSEVTGVGGLLLPGNYVDVIAVFPNAAGSASSDNPADIKSVTLLQNVQVLSVAQEAQQPVPQASDGASAGGTYGQRPEDVERQPQAQSATLAVAPGDAQLLALVQETGGVIWLSLRAAGDQQIAPPSEANLLQFISPPALAP